MRTVKKLLLEIAVILFGISLSLLGFMVLPLALAGPAISLGGLFACVMSFISDREK